MPADLVESMRRLEARALALERERDGLRTELGVVRARVVELESEHAEVANRIDWVVDSLRSAIEGHG